MKDYVKEIEAAIERYIPQEKAAEQQLIDAVRYSLNLKGKRVRPSLTLAFAELCGGSVDAAMPFACAVEMVHTYSLIHDDLPCMDNDDFRRGQPTNHKVFGENIALLAGDALQSMAYTAMLSDEAVAAVGGVRAARAAHILAEKSGLLGMVGGQVIDLSMEHKTVDIELVRLMEEKKTANLIEAACMMGCVVAGAEEEKINAAERYAHAIGLAFQIVDDILDVTSTAEELGKPIGSDIDNEKNTFMSLLGIERCRESVAWLTEEAIDALNVFDGDTKDLADFAVALANRKK
ncbi:farnesyl diphosphate synthase [uncultured Ruminococcus sp.]|uniref:polyprenyl synthetase family protein n=1 Tax=uncultured Ruminococcus sp. TaxID=165186 RepID=UPI002930B118|nr:farnesyl diphosphate synthase [uncultured Ruminococcus sp.]